MLGRFAQPDTIIPGATNPQAWNRYSYVTNSPINYSDPSGHAQCRTREDCEDMGTTPMGGSNGIPIGGGNGGEEEDEDNGRGDRNDPTDDLEIIIEQNYEYEDGTGDCFSKIERGYYIRCDGDDSITYLITDPIAFSEYLLADHLSLTQFLLYASGGTGFGALTESLIATAGFELFGDYMIPETMTEIGRYIGQASTNNSNSDVLVTLAPTYYRRGPYTNLKNGGLLFSGTDRFAILIQSTKSNEVQPIFAHFIFAPEVSSVFNNRYSPINTP